MTFTGDGLGGVLTGVGSLTATGGFGYSGGFYIFLSLMVFKYSWIRA